MNLPDQVHRSVKPRQEKKEIIMQDIPWIELADQSEDDRLRLVDGSRVGVIGGGPAGSFFSFFLLDMAARVGLDITVDIYEPRDFSQSGPAGCNMCGGIISESLVQTLATEGIILPPTVVERGIDSYCLHMDVGSVSIETPLHEKRIASVHRGSGPRGIKDSRWFSFDGYLLRLATDKGANVIHGRITDIQCEDGRFQLAMRSGAPRLYDLVAVTTGVNTAAYRLFEGLELDYRPPRTTKAFICEYHLGVEKIEEYFGSSMQVFLLNMPRLEFAAIIPKGEHMSLCLLGDEIDTTLVQSFLNHPVVQQCLPPHISSQQAACHCSPRINIKGAAHPFADRLVFIGDCGVSRLYKDGIGAAYRSAKAAATTVVFEGISAKAFEQSYWPTCRVTEFDNTIGKFVFTNTRQLQKLPFARRAIFRMTLKEQQNPGKRRHMSTVLWDMFTGSAPYREIFLRTLHPGFWVRFLWDCAVSIVPSLTPKNRTALKPSESSSTVLASGENSTTNTE
jgi:flavin-dependent dehydrogenase